MSAAVHGGAYAAPQHYPGPQQAYEPGGDPEDGRPTLLVTTVDIGEGRAGRVEVRAGDDPVDVARAFCSRHGLPDAIVMPLALHLEENLAETGAGSGSSDGGYDSQAEEETAQDEAQPMGFAGSRSATAEASAGFIGGQPSARSELSKGSCPGSATAPRPSSHAAGHQQQQPAGPAAAAGKLEVDAPPQQPLNYRPACPNSARGAEFFSQPPASVAGSGCSSPDRSAGLPYRLAGGAGALPAHARLYADHFRKQQRLEEERRLRDLEIHLKTEQVHIAPASEKLASHRTTNGYRNYGERLYVEGRLEAMRKEQLAQRAKEEEARAEVEACAFHPSISKLAHQIKVSEAELAPGTASAYQRLYQRGDGTAKRQERMAAIRREQDEAEVRECSFRPRINSKSQRMVEQRQLIQRENGLPGYEQLYHDSQRRRLKLEALAAVPHEEATFRPRINTSSVVLKKLMEGREAAGPLDAGSDDVAMRLLERGRKYQEKLQQAQRDAEVAPRDASTGRLLFQPKTFRAPHYDRNPEGAPIGERLYSIKAEWDEKAARLRSTQEERAAAAAASTYVNARSERMVERLKRDRFTAVFDYLRRGAPAPTLNLLEAVQDEEFMDTIDPEVRTDVEFAARLLGRTLARRQATDAQADSATSAASGGLTSSCSTAASAASVHQPALAQCARGEVDAAAFVALMEDVVSRTKGLTRQYLLPMPLARQKFEEPSFRPAIDPRSQALAARMRPESLPTYELLYKTAEEQAARREEQRRVAEVAKLKDCSFRPVMVAAPRAKEGRAIKLAAELTQSKRGSSEEEAVGGAGPQPAAAPAPAPLKAKGGKAKGGAVQFDALEKQINEALLRLSLSEDQVVASLRQALGSPAADNPGGGQQDGLAALPAALAGAPVGQSLDADGYRLDFRALLGTPTPDSVMLLSEPAQKAQSSLGRCPLEEAGGPAVTWNEASQEVVATLAGLEPVGVATAAAAAEQLAGLDLPLDLHALATVDLPEHPAVAADRGAPAEQPPAPAGEGSDGGNTQWETPRELLSPGVSPVPAAR